ncbi:NAD-binding protein [Streptomyces sp. NBC_00654]|nr:NAD-binding protein [Streptomyces sp. NBC_00654]
MTDTSPRRAAYTVVGGGAIGGTLAFALARAGHPVTVVDTDPAHVAAIRADGFVVAHGGTRTGVPVAATTPDEFDGTLGRVLLAVKAQATATAAAWIAPRLAPDGCVVSLQNGFNENLIARHVGAERTVAAFVNIFADVIEPGVILDGGAGALVIGDPDGAPVSARVRSIVSDLRSWGPAVASDNVEGYLWAKALAGARRQLRHLAALSERPHTSGMRASLRLAMHRIRRRALIRQGLRDSPLVQHEDVLVPEIQGHAGQRRHIVVEPRVAESRRGCPAECFDAGGPQQRDLLVQHANSTQRELEFERRVDDSTGHRTSLRHRRERVLPGLRIHCPRPGRHGQSCDPVGPDRSMRYSVAAHRIISCGA